MSVDLTPSENADTYPNAVSELETLGLLVVRAAPHDDVTASVRRLDNLIQGVARVVQSMTPPTDPRRLAALRLLVGEAPEPSATLHRCADSIARAMGEEP